MFHLCIYGTGNLGVLQLEKEGDCLTHSGQYTGECLSDTEPLGTKQSPPREPHAAHRAWQDPNNATLVSRCSAPARLHVRSLHVCVDMEFVCGPLRIC